MTTEDQKVFISYARSDKEFALKLAKSLRSAGIDIWIDQLDISPGANWDLSIKQGLENSGSLLIVLSPATADSDNVMNEVAFMLNKNKEIIPLLFKECEIPILITRRHYVDFTGDYDSGIKKLLNKFGKEQSFQAPLPKTSNKPVVKTKPIPPKKSYSSINYKEKDLRDHDIYADKTLQIFISHPHILKNIADALRETIDDWSSGGIVVNQTSDAGTIESLSGDILGLPFFNQIERSNVIILIYGKAEYSHYSMMEVGIAAAQSNKRIIVFQCENEIPTVFNEDLIIHPTMDSIENFTHAFHLDDSFFPNLGHSFAPKLGAEFIKERSRQLFHSFNSLLSYEPEPSRTYSRWICLTVSLSIQNALEIKNMFMEETFEFENLMAWAKKRIEKNCVIDEHSSYAPMHFNSSGFHDVQGKFVDLYNSWQSEMIIGDKKKYLKIDWWSEICTQIIFAIIDYKAVEIDTAMKSGHETETWYIPIVTEIDDVPSEGKMKFKICLFRIPENGKHLKISF